MPYEITYQEIAPNIGNPATITSSTASADLYPVIDGSTYRISVVAINAIGVRSPAVSLPDYTVVGKSLPPADVASISVQTNKYGNYVSWTPNTEVDLAGYEVRVGASWDIGTQVHSGGLATSFTDTSLSSGGAIYWIKAIDTTGNVSINAVSTSITALVPTELLPSISVVGKDYLIQWQEPNSTYAIDYYSIRIGGSWELGTDIGSTKSTVFQNPINWVNTRIFHITAVDIAGNESISASISLTVSLPIAPVVTSQVIDNNVLLYWTSAEALLPIDRYEIRKGTTYASATVVGTKSGLFTTLFETASGTYTYWVVAIDSAGNYGTPKSTTTSVNQPPDYELSFDFTSNFTGTVSNAEVYSGEVSIPHKLNETWQSHFTSRGWTTPQDQITAGYPVYAQPTGVASGFYEETIDYGAILAANKITILYTSNAIVGSPVVTTTISVKTNLIDAWTNYVGVSSVYATNFRYVKIKISVTSTGLDFIDINYINVKLDAKRIEESGTTQCVSTDAGGTYVTFTTPFVDITSLTANYIGTTQKVDLIIDFVDIPNPAGFSLLLYNSAGARMTGNVSWNAKGY